MKYVYGTVYLTFLITKTFLDKLGAQPFPFIYFDILTISPILNLGSLLLIFLLDSIYVLVLFFTLIVPWYTLLYSLTISSYLSIYTFFDNEVIYL